MKFETVNEVYRYLSRIPKFQDIGSGAARFDLERFERFCEVIGNPQHGFRSIHVAGTNGKGSTCQILASVYQHAGYHTGLYVSPHILDYRERFRIDGQMIDEAALTRFFREYIALIESFRLTYFEISTAIAFWWFCSSEIDIGIIETGLGGRLDATNIINPALSIITNISLDHTQLLGNTIGEIAREKAGIIKKETPVVTGNVPGEALEVILEVAEEQKSDVFSIEDLDPRWEKGAYFLKTSGGILKLVPALIAPVQAFNIAVSWKSATILNDTFPVDEHTLKEGIEQVRTLFPAQGRFELLIPDRKWFFDGAHNIDAIKAMKQMVRTIRPVSETILVLSLMKDKITDSVVNEFSEFKKIFYYSLNTERAASFEDFRMRCNLAESFPAETDNQNSLFKEFETELVIFAGSFYFYATVRDWLDKFTADR